jgi:hypothetical protein
MNSRMNNLVCVCVYAAALLAGLGLAAPLRAQSVFSRGDNRLLLIFDTSSAMKKRLPAEERAIKQLFALTLYGQFRLGDSIGVWTFDRDLHLGQFPQLEWSDHTLSTLPSELIEFLEQQRYAKQTRFDALISTLNEVVRSSPRLTIIIFCDGGGQVSGIPAAAGINASFKQHHRQMERARVPFVVVLRSQFDRNQVGQYCGCTISSADSITIPQFPPMPPPPPPRAPAPPPAKAAPQLPPSAVVPSLIVIGTNSATNQPVHVPALESPQPQPVRGPSPQIRPNVPAVPVPPAASPAPSVPLSKSKATPPPPASIQPTNKVSLAPPITPGPTPPATATTLPPQSSGSAKESLWAAAAALFLAAIAAIYFILRRARSRHSSSLISESFKKEKIQS